MRGMLRFRLRYWDGNRHIRTGSGEELSPVIYFGFQKYMTFPWVATQFVQWKYYRL